ncbi:spore germination protein (amino acid permease) [Gracilibacillus orientalis]|uniref:Spore germination protein (Amino acid permease) n=1 Tax=Gracilibacillus orientalis TaxID=334253 RepID=A0A1I4QGY0_9BACI|nr:GerAB/ArcD/ProY family transporter [Gracilibacillus orientalis]SFM39361.1 spore germination protein (amino acid permease) [Gracilibacillus orientalis]
MNHFKPDISQMVSPFLLLYIIHATQIGEGILSFERQIASIAGFDAWISIILTGVLTTIIIVVIWKIIGDQQRDFMDIHQYMFGNILGKIFTFIFGLYLLTVSVIVLISYIEIIQIWFFPDMSIYFFLFVLFVLIIYICLGGFRTVVGFAFFSFFVTAFLAIFKYEAFAAGHVHNLLPVFNTPFKDIILAIEPMSFSFLGIELILIYAPFIHRFQSGLKWAISSNILTTSVYLFSAIALFIYYNDQQIQLISWPTLQLWKVINFPIVERFEYVGIGLHFIAIIATSCLYFWASIQCFHRLTNFSFRKMSIFFSLIGFSSIFFIHNFLMIEKITTFISRAGVILLFAYIPLLYLCHKIVSGVKKKHANN